MKLHLPKMLAAAVLAAIASVSNLTCAAEAVDATFTTTNSVTTSANNFWANGFTCVLTGARLATTSEPTGVPISGCETVTLQSITSNIRSSAAGGTGLALISSTGEVLSLATNSASAAGDFTWTFTDATVSTNSALYFAYYDAANTNVVVGYTLQTGGEGDLFKAGASTLRNYGGTSDYATCAFLGSNNVQDLTPQNSQYAPYLVITTTGSATPLDQYNWNGTGTTAAWDTTSKNWLVGETAGNYVNSTDGIVNFGDGTVAKEVTVNEAIEAGTVNVSDNYTFKVGTSGNLVMKSVVADGYTVTMDGEGTISLGAVRGTLAISSGTTVAMSTMPDLAAVTMEDGATLDLSSFSASIGNIKSIASGVTGDKTVRISAEGERAFDNGQTTNLLTNLEFITSAEFNGSGWSAERVGHVLNVGDGSQAASIKVAQDLRLESKLTLNIASGSSAVVGGELILGHRQTGNPGLVNVNGGTLTVGHIRPWDASTPNTVSLYDGTLEITQSGEVFTGDGATSTVTTFTTSGASTVKNLSGGDITWNHAATVDGTLTLDTGAQNATFAGALEGAGTLDKAGAGTLVLEIPVLPPASTSDPIPTNAATTVGVTVSEGTLRLATAELEIPTITVGAGATLDATGEVSTKTAVTLGAGSTLAVGNAGLVLLDDSSLNLPGTGTFKFQYGGTVGSQVVIATGLSIDHISGVTFTQDASTGEWYADATCVTVDAPLQALNQLRLLGTGDLVLTKATGGGSYWGAGIGSGPWDLSTENWATGDGDSASGPFTNASAAHFTAAGSGGEISVGTGIDVTTIYVSGSKAYTFTNADRLTISGGINVSDSGKATFDKLGGEIKSISIADAGSTLTVSNGGASVQTLNNAGTLTVKDTLTLKTATTNGGSVKAAALALTGENTFASVQVSGAVSGASKLTVGGASAIGSVEGIGTLALNGGTLSLGNASGLASTQLGGALALTGEAVNLGSVTMTNGSSISSSKVVVANGITVSGTGTVKGGATLQAASVGGTGTLAVENATVGIASGSTMSVSSVLDVKSGAHISNSGTLAVTNTGRVIAGNGVNLGTVNAKGAIELDGAAVSATGGSIAALDMGSGETLTVANNLALATTAGSAGTLSVGGTLTVGGAATIGNVSAGKLELTTAGTLTATGTLNAGTITLDRVSKTDHYLTAGGLSESTTAFVVDKALIEALNVSAGQIITLADLDTVHTGAANLTINGAKYITDTHDLGYHIAQDSVTKDIILIARNQESNYVWVGVNENWSDAANWSGGMVPDETSWVQFNGGEQSILLDTPEPVQTRRLTVSAGTHDTIYGDQNLLLSQSLEVDGNASLNVGDGSTETMVSAPEVQVSGELNVQANAFVDAKHTTIKGGVLNVADGGSYFTGVVDMTEGGSLYTEGEASIAAEQLNGGSDSTVGGNVTIYGNGGRYAGGYDGAHISVVQDASATLNAGEGLTLHGDGTVELLYTGDETIDGVEADSLHIILNNPNYDSGATLTLGNDSSLENGTVEFGMSAVKRSAYINPAKAPHIVDGDLVLGEYAWVVVNQDRDTDKGKVMQVGNRGETRNLVLAHIGSDVTNTQNVQLIGDLYYKYYKNARIENGALTVDLNDTYYQTESGAHSPAGIAGAGMLDDALVELNPQAYEETWNGDLATVMTALDSQAYSADEADRILAAMSGTSHAAMGTAWSHDVDRQLRAIRNRTTSMGVGECVVNEDMPFVNAWINAEGDYSKFNNDGTLAGYKLSSWGGTFGVDVDCTNRFTMGLAVTAMNGDFTALGDDNAEGDLDRMYVSVFGRYTRGSWTHTLVGTIGMADTNLKRTVDYGAGSYATESGSDGTAYGVMYEAGYAIALNESASTCLQPVFNVSYRHSSLDGFTETGDTDAALRGGDAASDVVSIALGARLQSIVGTSVYNRSSIFEGRVLFKFDAGDRDTSMHSSFVNVGRVRDVRSAEMGCFGLELGAGIVVPVAEDGGSLFFDVTAELRDKYTEVNGTAGYRYNF
ncbi:MAG: autotransporter domain-containing protein [Akkermansia sp.]|nr:autotransporter domain-containing protein [Akkermansia sp.]